LPYHHPEDMPIWMSKAKAYLQGDSPIYESEHRIRTKAGTWNWIFTRGKKVSRTSEETSELFIGFAMNVTELKLAEEEIARTAQEWQTTFDVVNDAIWLLDKEQRVLRSNKIAERLFQRPREEIIGKHCWEIVHGAAQPIPECPVLRASINLRREVKELQIGEHWFEITADPILDAAGRYGGAVHIISDITEHKRATEQLNEQLDELRRWNKAALGRETRIIDLKHEVNELLAQAGLPPRYPSAEAENP
jgi:PAS domain S-box-containing protein